LFIKKRSLFQPEQAIHRPINLGGKENSMNKSIIKSNGALTVLLTFTFFSIASAQTPAAGAQSDIASRVDQLFSRFDRPDSPGCALGVIKDGKLIYKKGYGMANL
jgi:CubicO group peptidase (beta-lactamase class C family)